MALPKGPFVLEKRQRKGRPEESHAVERGV
jgi:hypothetical protein